MPVCTFEETLRARINACATIVHPFLAHTPCYALITSLLNNNLTLSNRSTVGIVSMKLHVKNSFHPHRNILPGFPDLARPLGLYLPFFTLYTDGKGRKSWIGLLPGLVIKVWRLPASHRFTHGLPSPLARWGSDGRIRIGLGLIFFGFCEIGE
jgi:hypothetical protein